MCDRTWNISTGAHFSNENKNYIRCTHTHTNNIRTTCTDTRQGNWNYDGTPGGPLTRHTVDANISLYDLYSTYLPAFKASVIDGGAAGVMCSYNAINGVPSCANKWLLAEVLRDEWKFRGYVTSDSGAGELASLHS